MDKKLEKIKVIAYLPEDTKPSVIIEFVERSDEKKFAFLIPPSYTLEQFVDRQRVVAAVVKYFYIPVENSPIVSTTHKANAFSP